MLTSPSPPVLVYWKQQNWDDGKPWQRHCYTYAITGMSVCQRLVVRFRTAAAVCGYVGVW